VTTTSSNGNIAAGLVDIARALEAESSPVETWQRITALAVKTLDGCEFAGISLVSKSRIQTVAATDAICERLDAIQYETGQGPCVQSIREHETLVSGDLMTEDRWPDFARRAAEETGIRSMLSFQLFVREDTLGALNLLSRSTDAFEEQACSVGALYAAHAALAMANAREHEQAEQLEQALDSSRVIGLALGILMEQSVVDRKKAFAILSVASQRRNVKLRDLAETVVASAERRAK
jgi:GAF domain-containing protein